ncbi:hypothetical protein ASE85_19840 [Sphingobium sp. Leaf26]|nr:hypothetical protein ASE85_19840 [Sphingobium sp. Leaf26]
MLPSHQSADRALKRVILFTLIVAVITFPILIIQLLNIVVFGWPQSVLNKLGMRHGDESLIIISALFSSAVFLLLAAQAGRNLLR